MKKILFIVNVDWFFVSHRLPLAIEATKKGYEVHLACGITNKKEYLESLGIKVHSLNISRSGTGAKGEMNAFIDIYKVLKQVNPDIVHFISIKPILYGGIASRFLDIQKRVFSISGLGFIFIKQGFKASIIRFFIKSLYKVALSAKNSYVIVQNPDDKRIVSDIHQLPITIIRGSGVDLNQYNYTVEKKDLPKVVMASRLLKDKGVFEYLEAVRILKNKKINAEFELYGNIDEGNPATLTKKDLENIQNEGVVKLNGYSKNIAKIFSNANIIVLPSYREGLPKVLIEAAACGRAVVTTDVPGCRDAIEVNVTGLLSEVKNSKSLAQKIEKLILDKDLRIEMGKAGRKLAEKEIDINKVIQKHFEIYENKK